MNLNDERKGFRYLIQALSLLKKNNVDIYNKTGLVVFGSLDEKILNDIPFQFYQFGESKVANQYLNLYQKLLLK